MANFISSFVEKQQTIKVRKVRKDKKKDVRVWVSDFQYRKILRNSKLNNLSITAYCSTIVSRQLAMSKDHEDFPHQVEDQFVHVKLNQEDYEEICNLSAMYKIPHTRVVVHRVLMNALRNEGIV